jgi:hypothetical protein
LGGTGSGKLTRPALLDDNRLGTAVAEILPDMSRFNRPLQGERLAHALKDSLIGSVLRF